MALTFLGFGTGGSDGQFGPLTRQAIANWQKKHGAAPTGFLTAAQRQSLLKDGAVGIANAENAARRMADQSSTEVAPEPVEKPKLPNVPDTPKPGPVKPPRAPPIWISPGL